MKKIITACLLVWLVVYVTSFLLPASYEATGDGFTRGMNRVLVFFGWQFGAALLAILIWVLGRSATLTVTMRWLTRLPAILAGALCLFVIGLILWANFAIRPPDAAYEPPDRDRAAQPAVPD